MIGFSLKDFPQRLSKALNDATQYSRSCGGRCGGISRGGYRSWACPHMGVAVAKHALLVRVNNSPYALATAMGPYVRVLGAEVYEMSNFTTVLGSRAVSMVPFQFMQPVDGCDVAWRTHV